MKRGVLSFILLYLAEAHGADLTPRPLGMDALAHLEYPPFVYPTGTQTLQFSCYYKVVGQTWSGSLRTSYDGYVKDPRAVTILEERRAFKGHSDFSVSINPKYEGVRVRRLVSRVGNGMQTAEVFVNGVKVGRSWLVLFNPTTPETQAWVDSEFELPASLTRGKWKLRIEVHHLGSSAGAINEFHYWVLSHAPVSME